MSRPPATPGARLLGAAAALLVAISMLSGCGGKDAAADPGSSSGSTSDASTSVGDSGAPDPDTVPPATGRPMATPTASLRAPEGWTVKVLDSDRTVEAIDPRTNSVVHLSTLDNYGQDYSLAELARLDVRSAVVSPTPKILPETDINGTPAWHVQSRMVGGVVYDGFGFASGGTSISVLFTLYGSVAQRTAIMDSVLQTLEVA